MKKIEELIKRLKIKENLGNSKDLSIGMLFLDSRLNTANGLFFALKGTLSDGHKFIDQAIANGAVAVICSEKPVVVNPDVRYILVDDTDLAMAQVASEFYDNPSGKLKLVGITGTNGKTTTATLLYEMFCKLGYKTGLLSTIENKINNKAIKATHTTPNSIEINRLLGEMVDAGCSFAFMEVSSHAIVQKRIAALTFAGGVFTNITHDHLDYHKTFDQYLAAKKIFFDELNTAAFALTNADDRNGLVMTQNTKAKVHTYALKTMADFKVKVIENALTGLHLQIDHQEIWCRLVGEFNAYNLGAIYATAVLLQQNKQEILMVLSSLLPAPGRFDCVEGESKILGIIDYAHTPDALKNVLKTINEIRGGNESLITVVGCGGDRDNTKRPVMASIAADMSTKVILTSDNPRSEDPEEILKQMMNGLDPVQKNKVLKITDREEAIKTACMFARQGDIVLIAGKGHENYQEIKGVRAHFDDKEIVLKYININK